MASKPRNRASMDAEAVARLMAAQDQEEQGEPETADVPAAVSSPAEPAPISPEPLQPPAIGQAPAFDPGKVDGRTLRRTGREPFATRIKPETHEALRRIAYNRRTTIAEALEIAVAAFDSR